MYIFTIRQWSGKGNAFNRVCQSFCPWSFPPYRAMCRLPLHWTCSNLLRLDLTVQGPPPGHVQICSLCSSHCQKGGRLAFDRNVFLFYLTFTRMYFWRKLPEITEVTSASKSITVSGLWADKTVLSIWTTILYLHPDTERGALWSTCPGFR